MAGGVGLMVVCCGWLLVVVQGGVVGVGGAGLVVILVAGESGKGG